MILPGSLLFSLEQLWNCWYGLLAWWSVPKVLWSPRIKRWLLLWGEKLCHQSVIWFLILFQRWGDAPVHSIAAALFARKDQIHFFNDIGYRHDPFQHCPSGEVWSKGRCACDPNDSFGISVLFRFDLLMVSDVTLSDYAPNSCLSRFEKMF